jgi:isopenicillin-N N-acyltransferase like protein
MRHGTTADAAERRSLVIGLKRAVVLASFAAAGLACPAGAAQAPVAAPQTGRRFRVVELDGTPYQRGLRHGKELREPIHALLALWKQNLEERYSTGADSFIERFLARTSFVPAIQKWTPGLLDEVRGIADGAGIDFKTMLTYQLVDEYWVNGQEVMSERCSGLGIAATAEHPGIVAQNMDIESFHDGFQTLLHVKDESGLQQFVLTAPGLIALNGMNSSGVGITANALSQLAHGRDGLPVAFVIRGVLQRGTFAEAESFLNTVRHASGQNYIVGTNARVAFFEASAGKVVAVSRPGGFVYHTNHPLANDDYSAEGAAEMSVPLLGENTRTRYAALKRRLETDAGRGVIEQVKDTLRSRDSETHPVCRRRKDAPAAGFSFASTIMVLANGQPYLVAAPGPPDSYAYETFRFDVGASAP